MPPRRKKIKETVLAITPIEALPMHERVDTWTVDGEVRLTQGDPCKVAGQGSSTHWRFKAFVTSPKGTEYIEVIGGERGCELLRSFHPDKVSPIPVKKKRKRRVTVEATAS